MHAAFCMLNATVQYSSSKMASSLCSCNVSLFRKEGVILILEEKHFGVSAMQQNKKFHFMDIKGLLLLSTC